MGSEVMGSEVVSSEAMGSESVGSEEPEPDVGPAHYLSGACRWPQARTRPEIRSDRRSLDWGSSVTTTPAGVAVADAAAPDCGYQAGLDAPETVPLISDWG